MHFTLSFELFVLFFCLYLWFPPQAFPAQLFIKSAALIIRFSAFAAKHRSLNVHVTYFTLILFHCKGILLGLMGEAINRHFITLFANLSDIQKLSIKRLIVDK